jgi:hypothetical protein
MKRLYKVKVSYTIKVEEEDNFSAISSATMPLAYKEEVYDLSARVVHAEPIPTDARTPAPKQFQEENRAPQARPVDDPSQFF